jgi:hypothetical protein
MMARSLGTLMVAALAISSGCCTLPCGPCGPQKACCFCLPCLPKPIVWNGCCNDCGPCPGESCGAYCGSGGCGILGHGGLFPWLRGAWSCGRGCGEMYCDEWASDPPACCDPCDQCHGVFTGQQGNCCLGPCQRLLAALHGYSYCAAPNCGPWRPIFGHCGNHCQAACGCGGAGCASCGAEMAHGADIYYHGPASPKGVPTPQAEPTTILEENWDAPRVKPVPGKPIHNARQPSRGQMGQRPANRATGQGQVVARPTTQNRPVGSGVRKANYQP